MGAACSCRNACPGCSVEGVDDDAARLERRSLPAPAHAAVPVQAPQLSASTTMRRDLSGAHFQRL